jgi:cysteine-rich repeat protein
MVKGAGVVAQSLALVACTACYIGAGDPPVATAESGDRDGDAATAGGGGAPPGPCGDGAISAGEECDDGNAVPGDGCHECLVECGPVPELEHPHSFHCYRFGGVEQPLTWDAAREACEEWGGTLAAPTTSDELGFLTEHLSYDVWIGGRARDGAWSWITAEPFELEVWASGHPGSASCLAIDGAELAMADVDCSVELAYVCERGAPGE